MGVMRRRGSESGAAGVEFALVFPLLLLLTFGIIEMGLVFYQMNMFEKATQVGVRKAITWDPVAPTLANYSRNRRRSGSAAARQSAARNHLQQQRLHWHRRNHQSRFLLRRFQCGGGEHAEHLCRD
jgi:Flp pilus assembly protein TadG